MTADQKKFLFETSFDEEMEPDSEASEEKPKDLEEETEFDEVAPTFSEEDLAAAREESFNLGKESGANEALEGIERRIAESLGTIGEKLSRLFQIQSEANERIEHDSVALAKEMVLKLFPHSNQSAGFDHISHMAEEVLGNLIEEARVIVRVNDQLSTRLKERLESFLSDRAFEGILTVLGDPQIAHGDCRIEWSNGSAERNISDLLRSIDQIIERNEEFLGSAAGKVMPTDAPAKAGDSLEQPAEGGTPAVSGTTEPMEPTEGGPVSQASEYSEAGSTIEDLETLENTDSDNQPTPSVGTETGPGATASSVDEEPDDRIAGDGTDSENLVSPDLPDMDGRS